VKLQRCLFLSVLLITSACLLVTCNDDDDDDEGDDDVIDDDDVNDDDVGDDDAGDDDANDDDIQDDDNIQDDDDDDDDDNVDAWTDPTTGLTWQIYPAEDTMAWEPAIAYCGNLGGGSWRLPTISELRSLIRGCPYTAPGGSCTVTDDCLVHADCWNYTCWDCDEGQGPAEGIFWPDEMRGSGSWYWSISPVTDYPGWIWAIPFRGGDIDTYDATLKVHVRCVR